MSQGGVIGKTNEPTTERASGLWRLEELFRARLGNNWALDGLIDFIYRRAKNDVDGDVFAYNPVGFIDPAFADQTAGLLAEVEVFHYSLATFPAGLTVTSSLSLGENADKPERVTALVVDGPLTLQNTIGVTNGRSRLAFVVLSRDDIDVGNGRNIVQPRFTYVEEPGATEDYRPYFLKFAPEPTKFLQAGGDGGRGGASGPGNTGGRGGSGGVAFGGSPAPPWPRSATGTAGRPGQSGPAGPRGGGGGGGGSPAGSGGPPGSSGGSLPEGGTLIVAGNAVTIPPTGTITAAGGPGGAGGDTGPGPRAGGGGGGAGGHPITIFHAGAFVNNGTITAAGGSGGPGGGPSAQPGDPGGAGEITVAPVPTVSLNR